MSAALSSTQARTAEDAARRGRFSSVRVLWYALKQFRRLLELIRSHWSGLAQEISLGLVVQGLGLLVPYVSKLLIDRVHGSGDVSLMHVLVATLLGVSLARTIIRGIHGYYRVRVVSYMNNAVRLQFFNHLQHLPTRFFDHNRIGEIMSRFNDIDGALSKIGIVLRTLVLGGIYIVLVPPLLLVLDWRLALLVLSGIPLTVTITTRSGRVLRPYWKKTAEVQAELKAFQVEILSHIRTFKAMALERFVFRGAERRMQSLIDIQVATGRMSHGFGTVNSAVQSLVMAAYTWWGWERILSGQLTLGDLIAFAAYVGMLYEPISELVALFGDLQAASVSLDRMFEYLDLKPEQAPAAAALPPPSLSHGFRGQFELRAVSFGYSVESSILQGFNLEIAAGGRLAIMGPSGSGKTSLLRLLTRMEEPTGGEILLDGRPLSDIPLSVLRRQISVVWQETTVIQGTLWDNLTLGVEGQAERRTVDQVVALCGLEALLTQLPRGYDAEVGEWGSTLSAGQRQRLALARAVIRDTPILILDEATSNIDLEMEMRIMRDLMEKGRQKTLMFVTHRPSAAALADTLCVLGGGRIIARGSPRDLLTDGGSGSGMSVPVQTERRPPLSKAGGHA